MNNIIIFFFIIQNFLENAAYETKINHDHTYTLDSSVVRPSGQRTQETVDYQPRPPGNSQPVVNYQPQPAVNYQPQPAVNYQPQPAVNYQPQPDINYQPQPAVNYQPQPAVNYQPQPSPTVPTLPPIQKTHVPSINYYQNNQLAGSTCGVPTFNIPTTTGLIIKGKKASRGQFPW